MLRERDNSDQQNFKAPPQASGTKILRVLILEDSEDDAMLLVRELRRARYDVAFERADNADSLIHLLTVKPWDLILSDYSMPHFRGTDALKVVREMELDIPFIFVSGTIQEDVAVQAMKAGAQDYLMKGNTKRLIPAVERELEEAEVRRQRKAAAKELRLKNERSKALHEINIATTATLDLASVIDALLTNLDRLFPYGGVGIGLFNKDSGLLEPFACRNLDPVEWKESYCNRHRDPNRVLFGAPYIIRNIWSDASSQPADVYRKDALASYVELSLKAKQQLLGTLAVYTTDQHEFTEEEIQFLATLAGHAAIAIHNCRLYEEVKTHAAELMRANTVKSEFLSIMSHELRTPLSVVMGYLGLMQEGAVGELTPKQGEFLDKSIDRCRELLRIINGILHAVQIEKKDINVEKSEVRLEQIVDDLRKAYEISITKDLALTWNACDLPLIKTDATMLKIILRNLIDNAIKFTESGTISISIRHLSDTGKFEFRIADTGKGIEQDKMPLIFDLFRQLDSSKTRSYEGLGLGLYLVKKNTELLGGEVRVESEPGKGCVFTVTLPTGFEPADPNPEEREDGFICRPL